MLTTAQTSAPLRPRITAHSERCHFSLQQRRAEAVPLTMKPASIWRGRPLAALLLAAACQPSGSGGGGTTGTSGTTGAGGTAGVAGAAGTGARAGSGAAAGTAGTAGSAGVAGTTGTAGGASAGSTGSGAGGGSGAAGASAGAGAGGRGRAGWRGRRSASSGSGGSATGGSTGSGGAASGGAGGLAAGYYVSPTGSDSNPGTMSAPFQTITKARDVVRTVNANMSARTSTSTSRGGTYSIASTIAFGPADSGTNGHRIFYQAYPGETPVLNGATSVTGWSVSSGSIYKASLNRSTKLRNLYVNDARATMTSKTVAAQGRLRDVLRDGGTGQPGPGRAAATPTASSTPPRTCRPSPATRTDLEIVNGTTWNENIVCVRDVTTSSDNYRVLLLQQPYGAIAQLPGVERRVQHLGNAHHLQRVRVPQFAGPVLLRQDGRDALLLPAVGREHVHRRRRGAGRRRADRHRGDVDHEPGQEPDLPGADVREHRLGLCSPWAGRCGKATVQGATVYIAYGDGNWHNSRYEITDTLPGMIHVTSADSISFVGNVVKHSGSEGISLINDVINSSIIGNYITDIAGSGITIGHPQHVTHRGRRGPREVPAGGRRHLHQGLDHQQRASTTSACSPGSAVTRGSPRSSSTRCRSPTITSRRRRTTASTSGGGGATSRPRRPARTTRSTTTASSTR